MGHVRWSWLVAAAATVTVGLTGPQLTGGTQLVADHTPGGPAWIVRLAVVPHARVHHVLVDAARAAARRPARPAKASLVSDPQPGRPNTGGRVPPPVRAPSWWSGVCNVDNHPGSFPLSSWDGLTACAPGPNRGGYDAATVFFPGAWGQYEWECVELSMRWMYLEYGVHPYPANGGQVVSNYSPADGGGLHAVDNNGSSVPVPGDVLSMGTPWEDGHTAVVTAVDVSHGYGTVSILEQNVDSGNGTNTIAVVGGVLQPEYGFPITGWLAVPPPQPRRTTSPPLDLVRAHLGSEAWEAAGAAVPASSKPTGTDFWSDSSRLVTLQQLFGVSGAR